MATIFDFAGISPRIAVSAWVAPTACVIGNVVIEEKASVWFGAVIRGDDPEREIRIGAGSNVQDNCVIHVSSEGPTVIGEEVTIGHGAVLESCTIGNGALIGMNAVVLQQATIGAGALVAAGAVVGKGTVIPPQSLAAGAPAVVKRQLSEQALKQIRDGARHYAELARSYGDQPG